jgi:hypothetical protein
MSSATRSRIACTIVIMLICLSSARPVNGQTKTQLPAGQPFDLVGTRVGQVEQDVSNIEQLLPSMIDGIRALAEAAPPDEIFVTYPNPCPEGYVAIETLFNGFVTRCVRFDPPPPPPAPPIPCREGFTARPSLADGSGVPSYMAVCEQVNGSVATVYVLHSAVNKDGLSLVAACPETFVVVGGGYGGDEAPLGLPNDVLAYASKPISRTAWSVSARTMSAATRTVVAYARCLRDPDF